MSLLKKCFAMGVVSLIMSLTTTVKAVPISLFNTGVDGSGALLTPGDLDPHWTITSSAEPSFITPGPAITTLDNLAWFANGPDSNWISAGSGGAVGTYVYETTFDLTGLIPATATISGEFANDNNLDDLLLNGVSTGIVGGVFGGFTAFAIGSGFIAGVNTLEFVVFNGGTLPNPHGLRVELSGTANAIPEPSSFLMATLGVMGLAGLRRRRHSK